MTDHDSDAAAGRLDLVYELDAPLHTVWRAISQPDLRGAWLPDADLLEPEAVAVEPLREIRYRMRDDAPPFLESIVTLRIAPRTGGGTSLRVIHETDVAQPGRRPRPAANRNGPLMRAA